MFTRRRSLIATGLALTIGLGPGVLAQPQGGHCILSDFELWEGRELRGANIFLGRNPGGGPDGLGDGPFSQADFDDLHEAGANYVHLSTAGLFDERYPYEVDEAVQAALDLALDRARSARLFAVIAVRTGPGRNEHAITGRTVGDPPKPNPELYERIWESHEDQLAWIDMWTYMAARYASHRAVIGYSVMVEPNAYARHNYMAPDEFYSRFRGTLEDFNILAGGATDAIREVDPDTPILLEPDGYGAVAWLPYLDKTRDTRTVYTAHDYTPHGYTHQEAHDEEPRYRLAYPGEYDVDGDKTTEHVDRDYMAAYLESVSDLSAARNAPVALTEFGVLRPAPGSTQYMRDRVEIQQAIGNWAVWVWQPRNFKDPRSVHDQSEVHDVLVKAWQANDCYYLE